MLDNVNIVYAIPYIHEILLVNDRGQVLSFRNGKMNQICDLSPAQGENLSFIGDLAILGNSVKELQSCRLIDALDPTRIEIDKFTSTLPISTSKKLKVLQDFPNASRYIFLNNGLITIQDGIITSDDFRGLRDHTSSVGCEDRCSVSFQEDYLIIWNHYNVLILNQKTGHIEFDSKISKSGNLSLRPPAMNSDGTIVFNAKFGVVTIQKMNEVEYHHLDSRVISVQNDGPDTIWVSTNDGFYFL